MIRFLEKETILFFHKDLIRRYGGSQGIRDDGLLESALSQPKATYEGKFLHKTIFEMAAAYGYHLCKNHPFIDGNKRISLIAMFTFLFVNGYEITLDEKQMYLLIMGVAEGSITKEDISEVLEKNCIQKK